MEYSNVQNELLIFGVSVVFGMLCGSVFDLFRSFRKRITGSRTFVAIQDILFWTLISGMFFTLIYTYNYGQPRFYIFLGVAIGVVLYMLTLSGLMMKVYTFLIEIIYRIIMFLFKIISFPIKIVTGFLGKINKKMMAVLAKMKKFLKKTKKQLKMY